MRLHVPLLLLLLVVASPPALADDLSSAFQKAREIIRDWKPSSSSGSNRSRDEREERSSQAPRQPGQSGREREAKRQQREEEKRQEAAEREKEKQRVKKNLDILTTNLASASNMSRASQSTSSHSAKDAASISAREQQLNALMRSGDTLAALRLSSAAKEEARQNAKAIQDALARGDKPPFKPLWDYYKYNRPIALGLVPNENKCAIVMSMTLGLEPRTGEMSLQDIGNKELVATLVGPIKTILVTPVKDSEIAKRYYIQAQQLADRLKRDWGVPIYLNGKKARETIAGKKGIIFLENAYGFRGDHIDLWDSDHIASSSSTPFERADKVWFWEIR